jgi:DNA polymerase alpha subunit B
MTDQSVLLEASRSLGSGVRIPLDLSSCPSYSIFPGQVVVLEGKNPDGSKFVVSSQKSIPAPTHGDVLMATDVSMMVAAGPYSMDTGALDFSPLDRLLLLALERRPTLLILVSPDPICNVIMAVCIDGAVCGCRQSGRETGQPP